MMSILKKILSLLILFVFLNSETIGQINNQLDSAVKSSYKFVENGNALAAANKLIEYKKSNYNILTNYEIAYLNLIIARHFKILKNYDESIQVLIEAQKINTNDDIEFYLNLEIGEIFYFNGEIEKSISSLEGCKSKKYKKYQKTKDFSWGLYLLSSNYYINKDYKNSLINIDLGLDIAKTNNDSIAVFDFYNLMHDITFILTEIGEYKISIEKSELLVTYFKKNNYFIKTKEAYVNILNCNNKLNLDNKRLDILLNIKDELIKAYNDTQTTFIKNELTTINKELAIYYSGQKKYSNAIYYYKESEKTNINNDTIDYFISEGLGNCYHIENKLDSAIIYFKKCIASSILHLLPIETKNYISYELGIDYMSITNYDSAYKYTNNAFNYYLSVNDTFMTKKCIFYIHSISLRYLQEKEASKAIELATIVFNYYNINNINNDNETLVQIYSTLSGANTLLDDKIKAQVYEKLELSTLYKIKKNNPDRLNIDLDIINSNISLSSTNSLLNNFNESKKYADVAYEYYLNNKFNDNCLLKRIYEHLIISYTNLNYIKEADLTIEKLLNIKNCSMESNYVSLNYFYLKTSNINKLKELHINRSQMCKIKYGENSEEYFLSLKVLGVTYSELSEFDNAYQTLNNAQAILKNINLNNTDLYILSKVLNHAWGVYYSCIGNDKLSLEYYFKNKEEVQSDFTTIYNISQCFLNLGELTNAKKYLSKCREINTLKNNLHDQISINTPYSQILYKLGQTNEAFNILEENDSLIIQMFDKKISLEYIHNLTTYIEFYVGLVTKKDDKYKLKLALYCEKIRAALNEIELSKFQLSDTYNTLGLAYCALNNHNKAFEYLEKCVTIKESNNEIVEPHILGNLGNLYYIQKKYQEAILYTERAKNIQLELDSNNINKLALIYDNLSLLYSKTNNRVKSEEYFSKFIDKVNFYISTIQLSENNFNDFYDIYIKSKIRVINSFAETSENINLKIDNITFSNVYKGISSRRNQLLKKSNNNLLKKDSLILSKINQLQELKNKLYNSKIPNSNLTILNLKKEISKLEEYLIQNQVNTVHNNITYNEIKNNLDKNNVAININKYKFYENSTKGENLSDSIHYAASIIYPHSLEPKFVYLKNGNQLENQLLEYSKYSSGNLKYKKDTNSYQLFWAEIDKYLKGYDKVYICPDGVFSKINIESLYDKSKNQYVGDKYNIELVRNLGDIVNRKDTIKPTTNNETIVLMGGADYDNKPNFTYDSTSILAYNTTSLRDGLQGKLQYLPGTKKEVEVIGELLKKQGNKTIIYTGKSASEENVKAIKKPKIWHIATHGFFLENTKDSTKSYQEPLLKTGLYLSGANITRKGEKIGDDKDDGVFTAFEALNLDLTGTELVVLSACGTGKGDVKDGEGIYGLPRAIMEAGAESVLMSMWNVDDIGTMEYMKRFYTFRSKGLTNRESYQKTVLSLKNDPEFNYPYYWASFILIDR